MAPLVVMGRHSPTDAWTGQDRALAHALLAYEATVCDGCGQPLTESTSDGANPHRSMAQRTVLYEAHHLVCWGCEVKADESGKAKAGAESARRVVITRKDGPAADN